MKRRTRKKWNAWWQRRERQGYVWWQGHHLRWTAETSPHGMYGGYRWPSRKPLPNGNLLVLFEPTPGAGEESR